MSVLIELAIVLSVLFFFLTCVESKQLDSNEAKILRGRNNECIKGTSKCSKCIFFF